MHRPERCKAALRLYASALRMTPGDPTILAGYGLALHNAASREGVSSRRTRQAYRSRSETAYKMAINATARVVDEGAQHHNGGNEGALQDRGGGRSDAKRPVRGFMDSTASGVLGLTRIGYASSETLKPKRKLALRLVCWVSRE
jgi:hypothetical protein